MFLKLTSFVLSEGTWKFPRSLRQILLTSLSEGTWRLIFLTECSIFGKEEFFEAFELQKTIMGLVILRSR